MASCHGPGLLDTNFLVFLALCASQILTPPVAAQPVTSSVLTETELDLMVHPVTPDSSQKTEVGALWRV